MPSFHFFFWRRGGIPLSAHLPHPHPTVLPKSWAHGDKVRCFASPSRQLLLLPQQLTTDSIDTRLRVGSAKLWVDQSTLMGVQAPKGRANSPLPGPPAPHHCPFKEKSPLVGAAPPPPWRSQPAKGACCSFPQLQVRGAAVRAVLEISSVCL